MFYSGFVVTSGGNIYKRDLELQLSMKFIMALVLWQFFLAILFAIRYVLHV